MKPYIQWPLDKNQIRQKAKSNLFGMVRENADKSPRAHQGWDFAAPEGTRCFAVADGLVQFVGNEKDYGNFVVIKLDKYENLFAFYAHLKEVFVTNGDWVNKGKPVAECGTTGNAKGMVGADQHLHFEFRSLPMPGHGLNGRIDPLTVFEVVPLDRPEYLRLY